VHDTTSGPHTIDPATRDAHPERRCWRCLQMFPCEADRVTSAHTEFWLCDPCKAVLLPSTQRVRN